MRALISEGFLRNYIRYVIVGSSGVIDVRESGSQLLNMLDVSFLEALSREDILKIIHLAKDVPENVADAVLEQCGGHPFIAQYLMYRIWEFGASDSNRPLVANLVNRFISERFFDLKKWLLEIGEVGQITYAALTDASDWLTVEQVRQRVNVAGFDIRRGLDTLCYHGLAIRDDKWRSYCFAGELFKDWFRQNVLPSLHVASATQASSDSLPLQQKVFISYSHKDVRWLERLRVHLKPVEREGIIDFWDDTKIAAGTQWKEAIMNALTTAKVAVLLVSADFLASDFIVKHELPTLLLRAKEGGTTIIPVIVSPNLFTSTDLGAFQTINAPDHPISNMTRSKQEQVFVKVAQAIIERFKAE